MVFPEMIKWNDLRTFEAQLTAALIVVDNTIKCYTSSLSRKKEQQHVKEQQRHAVESRAENLKRLETKKNSIKQQLGKVQEQVIERNYNISELITELEHLKIKKQSLDKEVEECWKELTKINDIHLKAMEHYKRKLQIRLQMEENEKITLQFTDIKASIILASANDGIWKLIATEPKLKCFNQLVEKLESTQDISGCLAHIRTLLQKKTLEASLR